jgi:tRNA-specific 2-thiouridylase
MAAKRVIVGMSGGVDSSVAALLLKQQGHEVSGLFMKNWEDDDTAEYCAAREDLVEAVAVAGRTPNPDVLCNAEIKFKAFLDHALGLGADLIATGHYAQVREIDGLFQLLKAEDGTKDQSYFLYRLNQAQLARTLFPLGRLYKRDVREIARREGLPNHDKKDSTGICFIGERPFREFLNRYLPDNPGEIRTPEGKLLGRHHGLMFYTIGQRQGLGIGGSREGVGEPWYVASKDMRRNRLVAVQGHDHPALLADRLTASNLNWISGATPHTNWVYTAKTRYRQKDTPCTLVAAGAERCVTPGQSVVVYESHVCLGGGIIESSERTREDGAGDLTCPPDSVDMANEG